jgi:hypothetical protein
VRDIGIPLKKDPGVIPQGADGPGNSRDPSNIKALSPETQGSDAPDDPT